MTKKIDIEKITDYNYFLLVTSFVFFVDTYLIFFHQITIRNIDLKFLTSQVGNIFVLLFSFSFFMAVVSKMASYVINTFYDWKFRNFDEKIDRINYMFDDVLELSIKKNNSVLYNYYLNEQEVVKRIYKTQYISTSVIVLLILNLLVSTETNISLISLYQTYVDNLVWYYKLVQIIPMLTIAYISYQMIHKGELYYIYLKKEILKELKDDT